MAITNVAAIIDLTLLKAEATRQQIETLCKEARENKFFQYVLTRHGSSPLRNY